MGQLAGAETAARHRSATVARPGLSQGRGRNGSARSASWRSRIWASASRTNPRSRSRCSEIEGFSLVAQGLTNEPNKKGTIALKSQINKKGSLNVDGSLQAFPLDVAVKLETKAIPLVPFEPYFGQFLNVSLTRGLVSNQGEDGGQASIPAA
jgi:hypothetical protein